MPDTEKVIRSLLFCVRTSKKSKQHYKVHNADSLHRIVFFCAIANRNADGDTIGVYSFAMVWL